LAHHYILKYTIRRACTCSILSPITFFQDGNKRTGLAAALYFLEINNILLVESPIQVEINGRFVSENDENILFNFTIEVASGVLTLEECQAWFKENIHQI